MKMWGRERQQNPPSLHPPSRAEVHRRLEHRRIDRLHRGVDGDGRVGNVGSGQRHDHSELAVEEPFDRRAGDQPVDDPLAAEDHLPRVHLDHRGQLIGEDEREQEEQLPLSRLEHHEVRERHRDREHDGHRRRPDVDGRGCDPPVQRIRQHVGVVLERIAAGGVGREPQHAHRRHDDHRRKEEDDQERRRREQDAEGASPRPGAPAWAAVKLDRLPGGRHGASAPRRRLGDLGPDHGLGAATRTEQANRQVDQRDLHDGDRRGDRVHDRGVIGVSNR